MCTCSFGTVKFGDMGSDWNFHIHVGRLRLKKTCWQERVKLLRQILFGCQLTVAARGLTTCRAFGELTCKSSPAPYKAPKQAISVDPHPHDFHSFGSDQQRGTCIWKFQSLPMSPNLTVPKLQVHIPSASSLGNYTSRPISIVEAKKR